jgi:hypothetical protein
VRRPLAGVAVAAALAAATACGGGGGGPDPADARREACADAAAGLAALPATGDRDRIALAAGAATTTLTDLAGILDEVDVPAGEAAAQANLRNAVAGVASGYRNLRAVLEAGGAGGLGLVAARTADAYRVLDAAAAALGSPGCGAEPLGRDRFAAYARGAARGGLATSLREAAAQACRRLGEAYGPTAPAVDRAGAQTQLRRSGAALREVTAALGAVDGDRAAALRTAVAGARRTLAAAERAVTGGADPTAVSQRAFADAGGTLRAGFRAAGVPCSALG